MGTMFNFIKEKLQKIYSSISTQLNVIFQQKNIDQTTIQQIQELLLKADTGTQTTKKIITHLQAAYNSGELLDGSALQHFIQNELTALLIKQPLNPQAQIFLLVGINGSGKTTFAGKLAYYFTEQNQSCLIAAADTFRAAAPQQLTSWAQQANAHLITGKPNQDPASVTFDACEQFTKQQYNRLIIDTAGRLQTKESLMKELEKIKRIIAKQLPNHTICTLLTIDAMLGQNSLQQAEIFNQSTKIDGIVLSKIDGSAKGGIIFSIVDQLNIPIAFLSWGEQITDITTFDPQTYVENLMGISLHFQSNKKL